MLNSLAASLPPRPLVEYLKTTIAAGFGRGKVQGVVRACHACRRIDARLVVLNLVYLGLIAFIPFPTRLLSDQGDKSFSVVIYAATLGLAALVAAATRTHVKRRGMIGGISAGESASRTLVVAGIFAISIPIAFVSPGVAEWTWALLLATGATGWARHRRRSR